PDHLYASGSFQRMCQLAQSGRRAIVAVFPRIRCETSLEEAQQRFLDSKQTAIRIRPRELVELALRNLHPLAEAHLWNAYRNKYLAHYYWRVGQHGLLVRSFEFQPLLARPAPVPPGTPDPGAYTQHFVKLRCPRPEDIYAVTDSDEICAFEFSTADQWCESIS